MADLKNPCVKVCTFKQDVCVGCGLRKAEIKGWKKLDKPERRALLAEADMRLLGLAAIGKRKG
jgi:predicted Fe-S protein YdhL (DUF1289 family)